jgi:ribosomal protein S18 acetylase RimI-like enzyme
MPRIEPLEHRALAVATQLHAMLELARMQEAALLGLAQPHHAAQTVAALQAGNQFYLGAHVDGLLAGVAGIGADDEDGQIAITVLAVHPDHQRRQVGTALVREALRRGKGMVFTVTVAQSNAPALALYAALGFVGYRQGTLQPGAVAMIKLRCTGRAAGGGA